MPAEDKRFAEVVEVLVRTVVKVKNNNSDSSGEQDETSFLESTLFKQILHRLVVTLLLLEQYGCRDARVEQLFVNYGAM